MEDEKFLTDSHGHRIAVQMSLTRYKQLLDAVDELDDIKAYRKIKKSKSKPVPFEQALREIEQT